MGYERIKAGSFDVRGLKELKATLDALPIKMQRKIARPAVKMATEKVRDACIAGSPMRHEVSGERGRTRMRGKEGYGPIKNSYIVRVSSNKERTTTGSVENTAFYAPHVEFGHRLIKKRTLPGVLNRLGKPKKEKHVIGSVPAHPFMYPALARSADTVLEILRTELFSNLHKAVK